MKASTLLKIASALSLLISGAASATIVGSHHDLSSTGHGATYGQTLDQVCIFCHAPHNADLAAAPLWNREDSGETFTMYNQVNTGSPTLDMTVSATPDPYSAACLSCHDGVTALDALLNTPYGYATNGATLSWGSLDTDLTNDHPISIAYNVGLDAEFETIVDVELGGLDLFPGASGTDQVECATCHDVHDEDTNGAFLRISNIGSAMCLTCHIK